MPKKKLFIGLVYSTVILLSILLSVIVYWRVLRIAPNEPNVCYFDEDLTAPYYKIESDKQFCGKASEVLSRMIAKRTAKKYNNNANPEYPSISPEVFNCKVSDKEGTTMHLKRIGSHAKPVPGKPTKLFWKTSINSNGGLRYLENEGTIYVQTSGRYHLTSQLTRTENASTNSGDQTAKHLVYLISNDGETELILLENAISACDMTVEQSEKTSNIGAVFELKEKDQIYVATTHPYNIISDRGIDHFTIFKL